MGIFDAISSWGSSALKSVSSGVSKAINSVSNTVRTVTNTVSNTVSNAVRTVSNNVGNAVNNAGKAISGGVSNSSNFISNAETAAKQAIDTATALANKLATEAAKTAENVVSGALKGLDEGLTGITGATYDQISTASNSLEDARRKIDELVKSGVVVPTSTLNALTNAEKQITNARATIQKQVDSTAKSIIETAKNNAAAIKPVDLANVAMLMNPIGLSKAIGGGLAAATQNALNPIYQASQIGSNGAVQAKSLPSAVVELDYGNPQVAFYNQDGSFAGYLGEDAKPYAVTDNLLLFNTGNAYAPGKSSWTNTPDSGKLAEYGLGSNTAYLSNYVYGSDLDRMLNKYESKGWLPKNSITDVLFGGSSLNQKAQTVSPVAKATGGNNPISSIINFAVNTRDNAVNDGIVNIAEGNIALGGAQAGSAIAADVLLPLDLMYAVNGAATGQEVTAEQWGYAALDAAFIVGGLLSGGLVYAGGKAVKTAVKSGKAAAKFGGKTSAEIAGKNTGSVGSSLGKSSTKALDDTSSTGSNVLKGATKTAGATVIGGTAALGIASALTNFSAAFDDSDSSQPSFTPSGGDEGTTTDTVAKTDEEYFDLDKFTEDLINALTPDTSGSSGDKTGIENPGGDDNTGGILDGLGDAITRLIGMGGGGTSITYATGSSPGTSSMTSDNNYLLPVAALAVLGIAGVYAVKNYG